MKGWNLLLFMLLYCSGALCTPTSEPTSTTVKNADNGSSGSSDEVSVPKNMNLADYYYSIFGKHLDYDYREPILTFEEPTHNELSDEIESEVDKGSDPWDVHSRKKRFIVVPSNALNSTRRWVQQVRRLRIERRKLRAQRRRQWQQNRIRYLEARSEALQKQAARLTQLQQRQQVTRSVPAQQQESVHNIVVSISKNATATTAKPNTPDSSNANATIIESNPLRNNLILTTVRK